MDIEDAADLSRKLGAVSGALCEGLPQILGVEVDFSLLLTIPGEDGNGLTTVVSNIEPAATAKQMELLLKLMRRPEFVNALKEAEKERATPGTVVQFKK